MRKVLQKNIEIEVVSSKDELETCELRLLNAAINSSKKAYAPYSQFYVGAAVQLENNEIIVGNNQENVAYPSGLCAERVAIYYANAIHSDKKIKAIAINAQSKLFEVNYPITPCGACRQAIAEYEIKQKENIKIIMAGESGEVYIIKSIKDLLPFQFNEEGLKKE